MMEQILGHSVSNVILYNIYENHTQTFKKSSHNTSQKTPPNTEKSSNRKELEGTMKGLVENKQVRSVNNYVPKAIFRLAANASASQQSWSVAGQIVLALNKKPNLATLV